jgi:hypothetical protein
MNRSYALGRLPVGHMNKTESAYAAELELRKRVGEIVWYVFEGVKLRLADLTFYTPDFFLMRADGTLECKEIKGYWEDDARVKIKVAASMFPFRFTGVKKTKAGWVEEEF